MIYLQVACNDPTTGDLAGRAPMLRIGGCEFEALTWPDAGPRFVELDGAVRLAGKSWPALGRKSWFGNRCWNAYLLGDTRKTPRWWMTEFLIWLRRRELYSLTCGPGTLFEWWRWERSLSPAEIHSEICAMDGPAA